MGWKDCAERTLTRVDVTRLEVRLGLLQSAIPRRPRPASTAAPPARLAARR